MSKYSLDHPSLMAKKLDTIFSKRAQAIALYGQKHGFVLFSRFGSGAFRQFQIFKSNFFAKLFNWCRLHTDIKIRLELSLLVPYPGLFWHIHPSLISPSHNKWT